MSNPELDALSPHEYLQHLQDREFKNGLPPFAADAADVLSASLIAGLPPEQRRLLDKIAIGVLPTQSVNAFAMRIPSGGEVIAFDFGLMSFLLALNKTLLCRVTAGGFDPTLELAAAAERAAAIADAFPGGQVPRWSVAPRRMLLAASLSNIQTAFVVGHEIGHFLLGHFHGKAPEGAHDPQAQAHAQEYAADERGAEIVVSAFKAYHDPLFGAVEAALAQAGVDIFFTYLRFLERRLGIPASTSTHPGAGDRQARLRHRYWDELPEQARQLADQAEKTFDAFMTVLK